MLAQVAIIVFGMFAVLGLVIDMGYVTLTRVQMESAAESAALEGLRYRNSSLDGFQADCERRIRARDLVRWTFDDDFDLTGDARQFGAGPIVALDTGVGDLNARQTMSIPDPRAYKPFLQLNQTIPGVGQNLEYGDMVSGVFTTDPTVLSNPLPSEDPMWGAGGPYSRNDFAPSATAKGPDPEFVSTGCPDTLPNPWPTSTSPAGQFTGANDTAFLVRLRRTSERDDLANVAGVSSGGPSLPLLFGRGSTIEAADPAAGYSVRHHGVTVRAAAIADAKPALGVGPPLPNATCPLCPPVEGVTPFALDHIFYTTFNNGDPAGPPPIQATIDPVTGVITDGGGAVVGQFVADLTSINTVGQPLPASAAAPACNPLGSPEENTIKGYVPVYQPVGLSTTFPCLPSLPSEAGAACRVVGFVGRIELVWGDCAGNPTQVQLYKHAPVVATENATALLVGGLPAPPTDVSDLMNKNRMLFEPLLAPVLAR